MMKKFEFELDEIDVENFLNMFYIEKMRLYMCLVEAEHGKVDYITEEMKPAWMRGYMDSMRYNDELRLKVTGYDESDDTIEMLSTFIEKYGENIYDENGNYIGHTLEMNNENG